MSLVCSEVYMNCGLFEIVKDENTCPENHDELLIVTSKNEGLDNPYVICGGCSFQAQLQNKMRPKKPTTISELQDSVYQKIRRISVPFSIQAGERDQCDIYSAWLGDIFTDEKNIAIFDSYIITDAGLASLSKYYMPRLKEGARVSIYTDVRNANTDTLKATIERMAEQFKVKIEIYNKIQSLHGRHIFVGLYHVVLDHGLAFLDAERGKVLDCNLELMKEKDDSLLLEFEKRYTPYYITK